MSASEACKLTARQKARLDEDVIFFWPPWSKSVAKWIFTVLLALAIFCGAVASRLSFMVVAISIMPDNGGNNTKMSFMEEISSSDELYINDEFKFLTLVVILMVPYGVEFLRCVWLHGFLRGHPWPSKVAVAVGIGISLMEVFGNCYFTIAVLSIPELSSTELILFMNGIFILPSLKNFLDPRKRQSYLNIMALVTVLFDLGGISWGIYKFFSTKARIAIPASLVLLNIAWFNPLRKWQTQPIKQPGQALYHPVLVNDTNQSTSTDRLTEFDDVLSPDPFAGRATIKSGIINSALKLCAVPFVSAFFCHFYETLSLHDISPSHIGPSMGFYWTCLWVNVLCSFVVYNMGYLACSMGLQCQAFAFPLMLVTPVCLFLSSAHWSCNSELFQFFCGMVTGDRYYHVLIIAAMLWIGLVAYVILYIWKPQEEKMAKEKDLFFIPYSYSGVFLEQYLILNREDRFVHRPSLIVYPSSYANVFLCTTVYREDPNVMEQYLHCLSRMYSCQRKYTSIETHIVFDDAFTAKGKLNEHAQNFINLSKDTLKQSDANIAQTVKMPYGSQIVITLEDGMQVYVHFKDSAKRSPYTKGMVFVGRVSRGLLGSEASHKKVWKGGYVTPSRYGTTTVPLWNLFRESYFVTLLEPNNIHYLLL